MRDDLVAGVDDAAQQPLARSAPPIESGQVRAVAGAWADEFATLPVTAPRLALAQATAQRQWTMRPPRALLALLAVALCVILAPISPGASSYLRAAAQARLDYRYDLALTFYARAHDANAADPTPLCASGDTLMLQQLPAQAAAAYRACAALDPADGAAWLRLGDALADAGDAAGAGSAWQRAGVAGDATAYHRLAEQAEGQGMLAEAARWWSQAPQDDDLAQGHLGLLALAQGDVIAARAHFFSLSSSQSAYAAQLRAAGVFLLAARPPSTALDDENIGYALLTLNEPGVALAPLARATQLAPTDGSARAYYGWTLWLLGQRAAARPQIAAGLRYSPALPFALYAAGQVAQADGHFSQALALDQTALESTPRNPALWSAAGDAALANADYVTAELSYRNAAQYSNDPAYTIALARFYLTHALGLGNDQALQALFTATRRFPTNEALTFLEGQIYDSIGQQTDAYYAFERAIALDPTDPGPWLYLGRYAAASGDVVPALVDLRTAIALQPASLYAAQARKALTQFSGYTL